MTPDTYSGTTRSGVPITDEEFADYFWSKVDRSDPNGCWPWTGSKIKKGYGQIYRRIKHPAGTVASRIAYWITRGPFDLSLLVCHTCDFPSCCRPDHTFLGTPLENTADMVAKGRQRSPRGEACRQSKLTADIVREIRASNEQGIALAARFGVDPSAISLIRKGRRWGHVQ